MLFHIQDIPKVTNNKLANLLYAPEISYSDIPKQKYGTCISIQGCVKMVYIWSINKTLQFSDIFYQ